MSKMSKIMDVKEFAKGINLNTLREDVNELSTKDFPLDLIYNRVYLSNWAPYKKYLAYYNIADMVNNFNILNKNFDLKSNEFEGLISSKILYIDRLQENKLDYLAYFKSLITKDFRIYLPLSEKEFTYILNLIK